MKKTITREIDITGLENDRVDWSKPIRTKDKKNKVELLMILSSGRLACSLFDPITNEYDITFYPKNGSNYNDGTKSCRDLENYEPNEKSSIELLDDLIEKLNNLKRILSN